MKLSSPNLNYLIIVGAMLMYSSIYFYFLPVVNKDVLLASCIVSMMYMHIGLQKFICNTITIVSIMSIGATLAIHYWILTCFWYGAS